MNEIGLALGLAQFAPQILRFFGAGEASTSVATKIADVAKTVTGLTDPTQILGKLQADPALALQFQQKTLEIDAQLEEACLADRKDARARDVEVRKLNSGRNERADLMVLGDALGLIVCVIVLAVYRNEIPDGVVALLTTIASIFGLCLRDAHQFEFGRTRSEKEKDQTISSIAKGNGL